MGIFHIILINWLVLLFSVFLFKRKERKTENRRTKITNNLNSLDKKMNDLGKKSQLIILPPKTENRNKILIG